LRPRPARLGYADSREIDQMTSLRIAFAAFLLAPASAASAQAGPRPISRADYVKTIDTRFAAMDTNHDGKVSLDEMVATQQRDLQQAKLRIAQQLQMKFRQLDTNKDGKLSVAEFMAAAPPIQTAETPAQMIQKFDSNHDGKVTAEEFRAPELAKFGKVDSNHDGVASLEEQKAAAGQK
jgi:Ca2+-binding EF-hand superfamily protein